MTDYSVASTATPPQRAFYSFTDLIKVTGLSKTTLWRMERAGQFPRRRQLTPGRVAWVVSEVDAWINSRCRRASHERGLRPDTATAANVG